VARGEGAGGTGGEIKPPYKGQKRKTVFQGVSSKDTKHQGKKGSSRGNKKEIARQQTRKRAKGSTIKRVGGRREKHGGLSFWEVQHD